MARLVLVGLPGSGKASIGSALARRLDCGFVDTDDLIAQRAGMATPELLRSVGEVRFRQVELEALRAALVGDVVVATGGGVVTTPEARAMIRGELTVWLDADDATLAARVGDGDRPLLDRDVEGSLARLRAARCALYAEVARHTVDATGSVADVTQRVVDQVQEVSA